MGQVSRICSKCGKQSQVTVFDSINVAGNPELRQKVMSGELFMWTCPSCGTPNLLSYPTLYHDPERKLMVWLTDDDSALEKAKAVFAASEELSDYTARMVGSIGELMEKVKISDAGLDDVVIEMCKHVTRMELGKDVDMKFLRLNGADNEIILTYPEKGQMEMLQLGFNVYEDCSGIISRNPGVRPAGLCRVDKNWTETIFK